MYYLFLKSHKYFLNINIVVLLSTLRVWGRQWSLQAEAIGPAHKTLHKFCFLGQISFISVRALTVWSLLTLTLLFSNILLFFKFSLSICFYSKKNEKIYFVIVKHSQLVIFRSKLQFSKQFWYDLQFALTDCFSISVSEPHLLLNFKAIFYQFEGLRSKSRLWSSVSFSPYDINIDYSFA